MGVNLIKLNSMKNFDLEAAKVGAPVCTRSGKPVRIICWDMKWKSGKMGDRIVYLTNYSGDEHISSCLSNGAYHGEINDSLDLMMRDDDYAEKLARGEYGKHIEDKLEKVEREHLRRELSEKIMVAMIRELAGKSPHSASNNITVYEAMAADAVSYADALLEELEKKK